MVEPFGTERSTSHFGLRGAKCAGVGGLGRLVVKRSIRSPSRSQSAFLTTGATNNDTSYQLLHFTGRGTSHSYRTHEAA